MTTPDTRPDPTGQTPEQFWQTLHESAPGPEWTPTVNARLAEFAAELPPGSALDLGCGAGGDTLWLARRGWHVTAVDIADAAVTRVAARVAAAGLADRVTTERHDLAVSLPAGGYDLVSAHYLHTPYDLPRARLLHDAAQRLRPGGVLLVVDHASVAPWSWDRDARFPTPEQTLAELDLAAPEWATLVCAALRRTATGPGGQTAEVTDNVMAVRRAS